MIESVPGLRQVPIASQSIDRLIPLVGEEPIARLKAKADAARSGLQGRRLWNVNSTAHGGGVAEMLHSLMPYVRGLGFDARWAVIEGNEEFFRLTKRLHHALHGSRGDGSDLGDAERAVYEAVSQENAARLMEMVSPGDLVLLHDPQTAGMAPHLIAHGAIVIWRCHVGNDEPGPEVDRGWDFLAPYLKKVPLNVFTREQYIPDCCDHGRSVIVPPSTVRLPLALKVPAWRSTWMPSSRSSMLDEMTRALFLDPLPPKSSPVDFPLPISKVSLPVPPCKAY